MCQVGGATGGGVPPVMKAAPSTVGGIDGGAIPTPKVGQVPAKLAGDAGAGANLIGGGPGDIGSILENLRAAIRSVMLAIGPPTSLPEVPGMFLPGPPGAEGRHHMFPAELGAPSGPQHLMMATSGTGRPVTLVRQDFQGGARFALNAPTGYDEAVKIDGKLFQFGATGRHVATVELATQVRTPAP